jgi:CBS domain-containing protein
MTTAKTHPDRQAAAARWALVTARDIMKEDIITISYATPLSEVGQKLSEAGISGAPVTDEAGHIVGILSLKDLVERYSENPDSHPRRGTGFYHLSAEELLDDDFESFDIPEETEDIAESIMTAQVFSVPADAGLKDIASTMAKHKIHRVLVKDGDAYVGIVSTLEILDALGA